MPKSEYFALQEEFKKLLLNTPKYTLTEFAQISGRCDENVIYMEEKFMPLFEKFVGKLRHYKIINYKQAACRLSYIQKHKYFLNKKMEKNQVANILTDKIKELKIEVAQFEEKKVDVDFQKIVELKQEINKYQEVYLQLDKYDFCLSNYYHFYHYTYLNFSFYDSIANKIQSKSSHIIKGITKRGEYIESFNIVFIDTERINQEQFYQHKEIVNYLNLFSDNLKGGIASLYWKVK